MMPCEEAQLKIIQRQTEGLMFHDEMADYFCFLHLDILKKLHEHQEEEELENLRKAKKHYIKTFGKLPMYRAIDPDVIPPDWYSRTSSDITENDLKVLIRRGMEMYMTWEKDTLEIYKREAGIFKEHMNFRLHREALEMIEDVQEEIYKLSEMLIDAASYDYHPSYYKK